MDLQSVFIHDFEIHSFFHSLIWVNFKLLKAKSKFLVTWMGFFFFFGLLQMGLMDGQTVNGMNEVFSQEIFRTNLWIKTHKVIYAIYYWFCKVKEELKILTYYSMHKENSFMYVLRYQACNFPDGIALKLIEKGEKMMVYIYSSWHVHSILSRAGQF